MWGIELTVMAAMIAVNSIFAAYEIALASVTLARLKSLADEKSKNAGAATYMKQNMEGSLAGIQLGITLVGAIAAATGGAGAEEQLAPLLQSWLKVSAGVSEFLAIATVVIPLTMITIIFGELIPKVFALRNKEWVCLCLSPTMKWFVTAVWPVVWFLETVVMGVMSWGERRLQKHLAGLNKPESVELQELRASVTLARTSRLIGAQEERIILGAAGMTTRPVREIILPADSICMLEADGAITDALVTAHLDMHTRFPLTLRKGDPQAIIGYVNFKDIVAHMRLAPQGSSLRKIMRDIPSFRDDMPVSNCLEQLIRNHIHIALIRDANNRVLGMVTMEDLIEELVGDIEDEYDHLPSHAILSGHGWVVGGGISLAKLKEITGLEPTDAEADRLTLNEWLCLQQGRLPTSGQVITLEGLRIVIRKVRRHKILEAQIEKQT